MNNMIRRGVMPDPDSREPWFLSAAHSEADVAETLNAFEQAVKEAKQAH
jgi:glutamate-1-semialdehyde 2,1-aminomutase